MATYDEIVSAEVLTEEEMAEQDTGYPKIDWSAPLSDEELKQFREMAKTRYGRLRVARFKEYREAKIREQQAKETN